MKGSPALVLSVLKSKQKKRVCLPEPQNEQPLPCTFFTCSALDSGLKPWWAYRGQRLAGWLYAVPLKGSRHVLHFAGSGIFDLVALTLAGAEEGPCGGLTTGAGLVTFPGLGGLR